ncbi:MCE family protein [Nocardia pseudobrasiliensis]|uniref:Phospholipid/cholesterol/gamma-HCH transport system substrate-binding protein n=1 Tax=Nocardia pseudobrasiliensis TaxID=45979 RepID=A0A370IB48_9NOCA|nr:MCE family protein [Nocardia pseudobrasiliensis]RDI67946.1 phospholipid/cholesterol/gamma-HCH transport system substrate-binding protein [Nocardia pseudobrasiliensis]
MGRAALTFTALAVVATVAAGATAAYTEIARPWLDRVHPAQRTICAEFTDTVGLYEGNSVTMLGVEIGRVTHIEARGDRMRLTLSVDRSVEIPADAEAVTMSSSIVTDRRVELTKPYTGGPTLPGAQCIPLERTRTPIGISDALDALGKLAGDLLGQDSGGPSDNAIGGTLAAADRAIDGTGEQFNALLRQLSQLVGDPADRADTFRRLVDNLDTLTTMFVTNWPDMRALLDNLHNGLTMIDGVAVELGRAVELAVQFLPVIARNVGKYDAQVYGFLDQAIPRIRAYTPLAGDIADLLAHLPPVTAQLPRAGAR